MVHPELIIRQRLFSGLSRESGDLEWNQINNVSNTSNKIEERHITVLVSQTQPKLVCAIPARPMLIRSVYAL